MPLPADFTGEFYQTFKGNWHQSFSNSSKNLKRKEHFLTSSVRPALPWYLQRTTGKPHNNIPHEHLCKNFHKTKFSNILKGLYAMIKWDLYLEFKNDSTYWRGKKYDHLGWYRKAFDSACFHINDTQQTGNRRKLP